jgi:hypothetical protein
VFDIDRFVLGKEHRGNVNLFLSVEGAGLASIRQVGRADTGVVSIMPKVRRNQAPKLEPELLDRAQGGASVGGAAPSLHDSDRVSGASVSQSAWVGSDAPLTIALCDGSRFTFARLVDLPTSADA